MGAGSGDGIVGLRAGRVRGHRDGAVWRFAGIPYARPPVGERRWRAPLPPEPWPGVRDARVPGTIAPQRPPVPGMSVPGDPETQSEDCCYLEVWTPGLDGRQRPVMVWLHPGGFTGGTGSSTLSRGELLAGEHDVVVVTCNYRLGALGFLAHPALADGPGGPWGNWGLLDQVAVLQWVRDHIAGFGGDPGNVTVFGESAGAMSICALLAMPAARGLFHRAIVQSGPPYSFDADRAAEVAVDLVAGLGLGLDAVDRARLEAVPAEDLVDAVGQLQDRPAGPGELPLPLQPVVDGVSLPVAPAPAIGAGRAASIPVLVGTTRDELAFFVLADRRQARLDERGLHRLLARSAPGVPTGEVVAAYRAVREARGEAVTPRDLWIGAGTDLVFRWPSLQLAAAQRHYGAPAFVYLFAWESPAFGGALGSCHALDIPFVFGSVRDPRVAQFSGGGPEAEVLSADMRAAWAAFARTGDPSHESLGHWPMWDARRQATMVLDRRREVRDGPRAEELAVWARHAPLGSWVAGGVAGAG
ncbi:MAG: carboxylesterase/lipase family protein, partial [Acidimicrobiales bacterium]